MTRPLVLKTVSAPKKRVGINQYLILPVILATLIILPFGLIKTIFVCLSLYGACFILSLKEPFIGEILAARFKQQKTVNLISSGSNYYVG
jgi:hypothetical protein